MIPLGMAQGSSLLGKKRNQNYSIGPQPTNIETTMMINLGDVSYNTHTTSKIC
jgi:hypothetical protein